MLVVQWVPVATRFQPEPSPDDSSAGEGSSASSGPDDGDSMSSWVTWARNAALILVLVLMVWLAFTVHLPSQAELEATIEGYGWAGWLVFILIYAIVAMTPIPVTIMAVTAGVLFGATLGSVFSVVAALIGGWGGYWLARGLGKHTTRKIMGKHADTVENYLTGAGFEAVATLRLAPGIPYWPVNYGCGALGIPQSVFLSASALTVIPGQVALVGLGALVTDPTWPHLIVFGVACLVSVVATIIAFRRWRSVAARNRRAEESAEGSADT